MMRTKVAPSDIPDKTGTHNVEAPLHQPHLQDNNAALGGPDEFEGDLSKIRSSFQDLVIYNDQGQPSIDINRLVYKPKKAKHIKEKEKLSWYLPDYIFIIFNFLCLTFSTYFLLNGLTIISWRNSMESFVLKNCTRSCACDNEMTQEICLTIKKEYNLNPDMIPYTIIRFYGFNDVSNHGLGLLFVGICNIVNIILGISACLDGNKTLIISHLVIDVFLFVIEVALVTILHLTGRCDDKDIQIVKLFLERHVKNYAKDEPDDLVKKDTTELDLIQISLTCCGVGNWTDYLPRSTWKNGELVERAAVERYNLDKSDLIIPSSCCRQWWVRNIYCAHESHMWAYPTTTDLQAHQFRQRISQWGCLPKMVGLCRNMVLMVGIGGVIAWILHFVFSIVRHICAIRQIQTINTLIRERKRIFRHKEFHFGGEMDGEDDEDDMFPSLSTLFDIFSEGSSGNITSQVPFPPKEKELSNMKSRKDFNKLADSMKSTHVENWVATGRAFVEGKKPLKSDSSGVRNRKKELARRDEVPNMQNATRPPDHPAGQGQGGKVTEGRKEHSGDALDALKLIQHVKRE